MEKPIELITPNRKTDKIVNFIISLMVIGFFTFIVSTIVPFGNPITKINLTFNTKDSYVGKTKVITLHDIPNNSQQNIIIEAQRVLIEYQRSLIAKYEFDIKYLLKLAKDNNIEVDIIMEETIKE